MSNWPSGLDGQRWEAAGISSTAGTLLTAHASADTKGAYAQLIAATSFDAVMAIVTLSNGSVASNVFLVDLAVGAAASEQILIADLHSAVASSANTTPATVRFPVAIPAGSRLAARCQASTGGLTIRAHVLLLGGGFGQGVPGQIVDTYGASAADSGGTSVDPGGVANTKGAYSEITAATTRPLRALVLGLGNQENAAMSGGRWLFDIAIGAAGSEQVVIPNIMAAADGGLDTIYEGMLGPYPINLPAGVRLAVRSQSGITDATDRLLDAILYGVG